MGAGVIPKSEGLGIRNSSGQEQEKMDVSVQGKSGEGLCCPPRLLRAGLLNSGY